MQTNDSRHEPLPGGTRVLSTTDGEAGVIINGFAFDPEEGGWTEYEVETQYGVERWQRSEFVLFAELEETTMPAPTSPSAGPATEAPTRPSSTFSAPATTARFSSAGCT
jgi:hypothetical protein